MKLPPFFVVAAVLVAFSASQVLAGGYQRTKDGKTLVWNNDPQPNDQATWSGSRDDEGYATGSGTLMWYRMQSKTVTGSNLPLKKSSLISRYTGEMVHGKLTGMVVAVDASGKVFHGKFINGRKGNNWAAGPAPAKASRTIEPESKRAELVEAPAEGPAPIAAAKTAGTPKATKAPVPATASLSPAPKDDHTEFDDSLKSLVGPPPALHKANGAAPDSDLSPPPSQPGPGSSPAALDLKSGITPAPGAETSPQP